MVAAYRIGAMEAFILRRVIRVNSVILANLVVGENVVPEFLQDDCRSERLLPALRDVLGDPPLRRKQIEAFARIDCIMSTGNQPPSVRAAESCWRRCASARAGWHASRRLSAPAACLPAIPAAVFGSYQAAASDRQICTFGLASIALSGTHPQ